MANAWVENGPVSLPPRALAYGAGALVVAMAVVGLALGFRAAWRAAPAPGLDGAQVRAAADGTLIARPIVELPPPVKAPDAAKDEQSLSDADKAKADALAAQTAEAQAIQAKPSKAAGNIDDILTSSSEKPPAPVKAPAQEAPPGAPVKSDVPF